MWKTLSLHTLLSFCCLQVCQTVHNRWFPERPGENSKITFPIRNIIYCISFTKQNGTCSKVCPQYIGETGKSARERCARHIGSTTNNSQSDTTLPVGVHFRLLGHSHSNLQFIPMEKVQSKDPHVCRVREMYYTRSMKLFDVTTTQLSME